MSTNATEFPCIEATRCLVIEQEMGRRLTIKTLAGSSIKNGYSSDLQNPYVVTFSKERSPKQEWYLHLDFCLSDGSDGKGDGKHLRRVLQMRHGETGRYLSCDETGRVNCVENPSPSTFWWLESVHKKGPHGSKTKNSALPMLSNSVVSESPDDSSSGQYVLTSKKYPSRRLTYTANIKGFAGVTEEFQLIASKNSMEPSIWNLKFTSGELCFVSNPVVHCQMRCNLSGKLSLTNSLYGWEVFRFIEVGNGDFYISSWTHYTKFLTSDSDGKVASTDSTKRPLGYSERWRLEAAPEATGLYIQNVASRRYLSVGRKASEALYTTTKPNDYALWHLDAAHSHVYYLTSLFASSKKEDNDVEDSKEGEFVPKKNASTGYNQIFSKGDVADMHISSSKNGPFLTKKKQKWEEWKIEVTPEGDITFFSLAHEKYLGCNSTGDVHTTTSKGSWSLWEKQVSSHGGVTFLSREHLRFLAVNPSDGSLYTTPGGEETNLRHSWRLDPRLPRSISGGKIAGAVGLAISLAMPFAVLGAIETAGAAVTELALLGTSVEALAGAVAGAAIGAGVVGKAAAQKEKSPSELSNGQWEDNIAAQRPISAWKSWIKFAKKSVPSPSSFHASMHSPSTTTPTPDPDVALDIPKTEEITAPAVDDIADAIAEVVV
uniref:Fascin domain-containing protein n=1 Tax=Pseudo-nitzschia australis TaxID=44445 RepID=A0A7S4AK01_9STRA|mmetsp:Transcript_13541/g.28387  ORF Transcript_13541/g.28387 Transcript_13541/m.28387 type:complete len:659 (+) Transcript_13541:132-2108(+)